VSRPRRDRRALWRAFASYRGSSFTAQAFVAGRLAIAPLAALGNEVMPLQGPILSLGSGVSAIERYLAELNPRLEIEGIDLDSGREALVRSTAARAPRVQLRLGDAVQLDEPPIYDAVLVCDVLHHLDPEQHKPLATGVAQALRQGGVCIVKDLDTRPRWKHTWNRAHDRLIAGPAPIYCQTPDDTANLLAAAGLRPEKIQRTDRRWEPYAHYIVRARKPGPAWPAQPETWDGRRWRR